MGKHEADADDGQRSSGATDIAHGIGDETKKAEIKEEEGHAKENSDDIRVEDDAADES